MRFGENNVLWSKYIDTYEFRRVWGGMYMVRPPYIYCLLLKKNTEKVQEHDLYLNQILHHYDLNFFS